MRNFGYGFTLDEICNKAAALYSCQLAAVQQARSYTKSNGPGSGDGTRAASPLKSLSAFQYP